MSIVLALLLLLLLLLLLGSAYAVDGGMYVPEYLPCITKDELQSWQAHTFPQVCAEIVRNTLSTIIKKIFLFIFNTDSFGLCIGLALTLTQLLTHSDSASALHRDLHATHAFLASFILKPFLFLHSFYLHPPTGAPILRHPAR